MTSEIQAGTGSQPGDHLEDRLLVEEISTPFYKSFIANVRDLLAPEKLPPLEVTSKPVAVKDTSTSFFRSLFTNIRDLVRPEKLPPLEVTSKPVAVKQIWGATDNKGKAGTTSLIMHVAFVTLL